MSARRQLPPPAGSDQLTALLRRRHAQEQHPIEEPPTPAPAPPAAMVRRSWYVSRAAADALTAAVDDLHHETRRPKHEVLTVLLTLAVEDLDRIRDHLRKR